MAGYGTPALIAAGHPGMIHWGPIGTAEPTDIVVDASGIPTDLTGFTALGYTDQGLEEDYNITFDDVEVEEELDPVMKVPSKRNIEVVVGLAQISLSSWKLGWNGGTAVVAGGVTTLTPPQYGQEIRRMLIWTGRDGLERTIYRQVVQSGQLKISRRKGNNKAIIPATFSVEVPKDGTGSPIPPVAKLLKGARAV